MKKLILLILFVLVLTGCDVTYTIDIDNDFNETITFSPSNSEEIDYLNSYNFNHPAYIDAKDYSEDGTKVEGVEYYNYSHNNNLVATYKFKDNYKKSRALNYCFTSLKYEEDENVLIRTTTDNRCFKYNPNLDKLTINIVTSNKVLSHNADSVSGNTYTWVFEKDGSLKSIDFKYKNPNYKEEQKENKENNSKENENAKNEEGEQNNVKTPWYIYLLISLFFVILFGIIIFSRRRK